MKVKIYVFIVEYFKHGKLEVLVFWLYCLESGTFLFVSILVFHDTSGLYLLLGLEENFFTIFPVVHIGAMAISFFFVGMMFHIQIAEIHEKGIALFISG